MLLNSLICTGIVFIFCSIVIYKRLLNPIFIILSWYISGIIISHSGIYGMFKPIDGSSEFILINILLLCFSFFMLSIISTPKSIKFNGLIPEEIVEKLLQIISIFTLLIQSAIVLRLILAILKGIISISDIRMVVYSLSYNSDSYKIIFFNEFIYNIFSFFIKGFILFDISWNLCEVLVDQKKFRVITLINLFLYCAIILSRIEILRIFIIFILIYVSVKLININLDRNMKFIKHSRNKILIFFGICMLSIFAFRTSDGNSILLTSIQELIISLNGSYVVFGNFFTNYLDGLRLIDSNIISILIGGLEPVFSVIFGIIGINVNSPTSILNEYILPGTNIGASDHYNAFYTMYYNFLSGGGIIGCITVSIFLGILLAMLYKSYIRDYNPESLLIYVFLLHIIILGSIRWELSTFSLWFMMILAILVKLKKST